MGRFELIKFIDLYKVAKENFSALQNGEVTPAKVFNSLCSIEHLRDWAKSDPSISNLIEEVNFINDLAYKIENRNHPLFIIRELCNAHKHFKDKNLTPDTITKTGFGIGRYGIGMYGKGEPSYTVTVDGVEKSFLEISGAAIDIWDDFVNRNGLLNNVNN